MSRLLYPAKRNPGIGSYHLVQENHSRLKFIDEALGFDWIVGPRTGTETETAVVCNLNGLIHVFDPKDGSDGTEELFPVRG